MRTGLDYGYRSRCCYAPIRLGRRVVKNTNKKTLIWVCCKCLARDVNIVQYTGPNSTESTVGLNNRTPFIPEDRDDSNEA
jgi:hypothetical protein